MALQRTGPGEVVDLSPKGSALAGERSTAIVKTDQFEAIRLIVPAGSALKSHSVPGRITLHCLEGHIELELAKGPIELSANQWVHLDGGVPHEVRGIEDASLLLTIFLATAARIAGASVPEKDQKAAHDRYEECGCAYRWESEGGHVAAET